MATLPVCARCWLVAAALALMACGGASFEPSLQPAGCATDVDCDDGVACTRDRCEQGACRNEPEPLACDDGSPCTRDACKPDQGCLNLPDREGLGCNDGDPCTLGDRCVAGACAGDAAECDDGDRCTVDACDSVTGACVRPPAPDGTLCDDRDACTVDDRCQAGVCGGTAACECSKDDDCAPREDGDRCNGTLICDGARRCVVDPQTRVVCDTSGDGACKKSVCVRETGACEALAVHEGSACEPAERCVSAATCQQGECVPTSFVTCADDGDPCTAPACDPGTGACVFTPEGEGTPCDDGSACTALDACDGLGACVGSDSLICADDNPCTEDLCLPESGVCAFPSAAAGTPCDDDNVCTTGDACQASACEPGAWQAGCCRDVGDCSTPGPCLCLHVACVEGQCQETPLVPCCGNGVIEPSGYEECEAGLGGLPAGACDDACRYAPFPLVEEAGGSVEYLGLGPGAAGEVLATWTWRPPGQGDAQVRVLRVDAHGVPLGEQMVAGAGQVSWPLPLVVRGFPVQVSEGQIETLATDIPLLAWRCADWDVDVALQHAMQAGVGAPLATGAYSNEWAIVPTVDLARPDLGRPFAAGVVPGWLQSDPLLWFATPADAVAGDQTLARRTILLRRERLDSAHLATLHPGWIGLVEGERFEVLERYFEWQAPMEEGVYAEHPALARLGLGLALVFTLRDVRDPGAPKNGTMALHVGNSSVSYDWGREPVRLWQGTYAEANPCPPALVPGDDSTYVMALAVDFQGVGSEGALEPPDLHLLRLGHQGDVTQVGVVLGARSWMGATHRLVRVGPGRMALIADTIEWTGTSGPTDFSSGLVVAWIDDQGATWGEEVHLVEADGATRQVFGAVATPEGGLLVAWVERREGAGRLRARLVAPPAP